MPEPIIKLKDLEITYNPGKSNEYKATKGVSMEIYPGEFVAFFGPSGCGKSTLFYCILGVLPPSSGELYVMGQNPYSFSSEEMVNFQTNTIGIIYQAFFLINSISVIDNVVLPQIFHGVAPGKRRRWAKELLKRFDMEKHGEKFPDNLSGGQSQRVSVSRSMVNNPKILLADEPTGNLDSVSTKQVMNSLEEINRVDKKTVIIITHNAAQLSYAHRVFYMKDGLLERIVPNPEKKQIAKVDKQKILVTEMDKLAKIYPYDTPVRLKVKSLVNYLTQDINFDQILRLENFVELMVERKICKDEFIKLLTKHFHEGGLGLSPVAGKFMADKVEKVLTQSEDARRFRRRFMSNNFFSREDILLQRLTRYISDEYGEELDQTRRKRLKDGVYKRVAGLISTGDFENFLRLPVLEGGVGVSRLRARKLTLHFEKILIQGTETKGNEH